MHYSAMLLTSVAVASLASPVRAQDAGNATVGNDQLEEIVVTAQKREQNLQNVPIAVTAVTGAALVSKGIVQFDDLTKIAPGLTITKGPNVTGNSVNLRGIGTSAFSIGVEPSVSIVIDDLAVLQQGQAFSGLSDIERVEVLRGPQGTLFGKGASAGVINIVTKGPSKDLSGNLTVSATTDEQYQINGAISGPLSDAISFRLNGFYGHSGGYIDNLFDSREFGKERNWGLRGRVDIRMTDALDVSLIASHADSHTNGTVRTLLRVPATASIGGVSIAQTAAGVTPGYGNNKARVDGDQVTDSKTDTASLKATLDLGPVQLVSITGYQKWKYDFVEDVDVTATPVFGIPGGVYQGGPIKSQLFSQELRLVSASGGPLQYLFGLYYADGKTTRLNYRLPGGPLLAGWDAQNDNTTYAAFAQGTYDITKTTHIDGGIRFNREKIQARFRNTQPTSSGGNCVVTCTGQTSDDQITGKISLRQDVAERVMVYASYATGYKGQGYDISTGFTQAKANNPVRAEHSKAYEIGMKSRFLDNRVQLNISAFLTDYDDFQAQSAVADPVTGAVQFQLNNVGKLRTKGVEVELSARPTGALTLDVSAAYTEARIRAFPLASCYNGQTAAQGCFDIDGAGPGTTRAQDLAGKPLSNAPKFKYTVGANYDIILTDLPFDGFISADYRHQSLVIYDLFQNPGTRQRAYGIVNASLGIKSHDIGRYRLSLFVNNLLDKAYAATLSVPPSASTGALISQVLPRDYKRYFGVRLNTEF